MKTQQLIVLTVIFTMAMGATYSMQSGSLSADLAKDWEAQKATMMQISNQMPEDTFNFKATPTQRSWGEQILHVAGANVGLMQILGSKVPAPVINQTSNSKSAILSALSDSFDFGSAVLAEMDDASLQQIVKGPSFFGDGTRVKFVYRTMMHTENIYGQMVVYLRLNGLVPPASQ